MVTAWQQFLIDTCGAQATAEGLRFTPTQEPESSLVERQMLTDLSGTGILSVTGEDAETFLNGQLTNDIREVSETRSQLSAFCNPKGRALALFRILRRDDSWILTLPAALTEPTLKRLRMYVLRSRVEIRQHTSDLACLGVSGPDVETTLSAALGQVPQSEGDCLMRHGVSAIRLRGPAPRFELLGPITEMQALWTRLMPASVVAGGTHWRLLDILGGVPGVFPGTVEAFVPQMINLDLLGGISFTKGCYTGQEIVARTHYLGKLKRRMYRLQLDNPGDSPDPGTPVFSAVRADEAVGSLVDAQVDPAGGIACLAVLRVEAASDELHLGAASGPVLDMRALPYDLETPGDSGTAAP